MLDVKDTIKFIKLCLRDEGYSRELIAYLLSTYDLDTFIAESTMSKFGLAQHLLGHARAINNASITY